MVRLFLAQATHRKFGNPKTGTLPCFPNNKFPNFASSAFFAVNHPSPSSVVSLLISMRVCVVYANFVVGQSLLRHPGPMPAPTIGLPRWIFFAPFAPFAVNYPISQSSILCSLWVLWWINLLTWVSFKKLSEKCKMLKDLKEKIKIDVKA